MWLRAIHFIPFHKRSTFVHSLNRFYFRFYWVYFDRLFVCLSNECSNEKYLDQNYGNIYCSLVFDKFVEHTAVMVAVFGSFVFFTHVHVCVYVCDVDSRHTLNRQKKNANHIPPVKLTV